MRVRAEHRVRRGALDMIALVVLCALGLGLGAVGLLRSLNGQPPEAGPPGHRRTGLSWGVVRPVLVAALCGAVAAAVTGWPVAFVIGAAAGYGLPRLFGQTAGSASVVKIEAIASWTEMLQGTLAASAGLNQAIIATAPLSPPPIREAAMGLSGRITSGMHPTEALLLFGEDLGDPSADRVICSLILAITSRAQRLGELLAALADSTRDEVALRLRVETSRASVRSGVRTVLVFSVGFAGALVVLAHAYLAPFATPAGQAVLVVVGVLYAAGLTLMVVMARPPAPVRLLGGSVDRR